MFQIIEDYIGDCFEELNERNETGYKVLRITNDLQFENIGASEADINYQLYISSAEFETEKEAVGEFRANVRLDFTFIIAGKDYTIYKEKFDNYVYPLAAIFINDSRGLNYTTGDNSATILNGLSNLMISNADRFEENYYRPTIEFQLTGWANYYGNIISSTANALT